MLFNVKIIQKKNHVLHKSFTINFIEIDVLNKKKSMLLLMCAYWTNYITIAQQKCKSFTQI